MNKLLIGNNFNNGMLPVHPGNWFFACDLRGSQFNGIILKNVKFIGCRLDNTSFAGCRFDNTLFDRCFTLNERTVIEFGLSDEDQPRIINSNFSYKLNSELNEQRWPNELFKNFLEIDAISDDDRETPDFPFRDFSDLGLCYLLNHGNENVRLNSYRELIGRNEHNDYPELILNVMYDCITDQNRDIALLCRKLWEQSEPDEHTQWSVLNIDVNDSDNRLETNLRKIMAIVNIDKKYFSKVGDFISNQLNDSVDENILVMLIRIVRIIDDSSFKEQLINALSRENVVVRLEALDAISHLSDFKSSKTSIPSSPSMYRNTLEQLIVNDPDEKIRFRAAMLLSKFKEVDLETIKPASRDYDDKVKEMVKTIFER